MKLFITGGTTLALSACQLGERFGFVTPTPEGIKTNPTETVPSTDQTAEIKVFAEMLIGGSGIGRVNSLIQNENPDPSFVAEVKSRALEALKTGDPNLDPDRVQVYDFEMQGEKGSAPFPLIAVSEKDNPDKLLSLFVGFAQDTNGVLVPPKEGKIAILFRLTTVQTMAEGPVYVGIQSRNDPLTIYLPPLFEVNQSSNEVFFLPPYTDSLQSTAPVRGSTAFIAFALTQPEITPEVTPEITPEAPVDVFRVEGGKIEQKVQGNWVEVQIPEAIGPVIEVEEHEGAWYGIDTIGRAMVTRNEAGEWVNYERPVYGLEKKGTDYVSYAIWDARVGIPGYADRSEIRIPVIVPGGLLESLPQDQIIRLMDGDSELPWGIIDEMKPGKFTHMFVSGYAAGSVPWPKEGKKLLSDLDSFLVVVIPHRYADQAVLVSMSNSPRTFHNLFAIPASSVDIDINEMDHVYMSWGRLAEFMKAERIVGHQIVFAFQMRYGEAELGFYKKFDERAEKLVEAIREGTDYQAFTGHQMFYSWLWVPEDLLK